MANDLVFHPWRTYQACLILRRDKHLTTPFRGLLELIGIHV